MTLQEEIYVICRNLLKRRRDIMKKYCILVLVCILLATTIAIGQEFRQTIEVVFNSVKLVVNGKPVQADNILYKGKRKPYCT